MAHHLISFGSLYVFVLAAFLGYQLVVRIPPLLHTPLMAATNAIDAITVVGAMVLAGEGHNLFSAVLGFLAVASAMSNVIGGFLITDRMLAMFKHEKKQAGEAQPKAAAAARNGK